MGVKIKERIKSGKKEYRAEVYGTTNGKRWHSTTAWCNTRREAERRGKAAIAEHNDTTATPMTFMEILKAFDSWILKSDMHPGSIRTIHTETARILKTAPQKILDLPAKHVTKHTIVMLAEYYRDVYKPERTKELLSDNSYGNVKKTLGHLCTWMGADGYGAIDWRKYQDFPYTAGVEAKAMLAQVKRARKSRTITAAERDSEVLAKSWTPAEYDDVIAGIGYSPLPVMEIADGTYIKPTPIETALDWDYDTASIANIDVITDRDGRISSEVLAYTAICVMYHQGLRYEEMRALRWGDIDLTQAVIRVHNAKNYRAVKYGGTGYSAADGTTKNLSSLRTIPMLWPSMDALWTLHQIQTQLHAGQDISDMLVLPDGARHSCDGGRSQHWMDAWIRKLSDKAGVKRIPVHGLRHSCARYLKDQMNLPKEDVARYLGHADTSMIDAVYAQDTTQTAFAAISGSFAGISATGITVTRPEPNPFAVWDDNNSENK